MVEIKNLTKKYGDYTALKNVSFKIEKSQITGLLGPNGAGKTTIMNIISGYIFPESGSVTLNNIDVFKSPKKTKAKIGYLPENPPLYNDMTVYEYLKFICEIKKVNKTKKKNELKIYIEEILKSVQLLEVKHKIIKNLSKGYKQRVGISSALVGDPPVIILDEPTVGLDPSQIIEIRSLIKELAEKHTVIISSHILSEVSSICKNAIIINHGKILADGKIDALYEKINEQNKIIARIKGYKNNILNLLWSIEGVVRVKIREKIEKDVYDILIESAFEKNIKKSLQTSLIQNNMELLALNDEGKNLEDVFLKFIQKDENKLPMRELYDMDFGHDEKDEIEEAVQEVSENNDVLEKEDKPKIWEVDLANLSSYKNKEVTEEFSSNDDYVFDEAGSDLIDNETLESDLNYSDEYLDEDEFEDEYDEESEDDDDSDDEYLEDEKLENGDE